MSSSRSLTSDSSPQPLLHVDVAGRAGADAAAGRADLGVAACGPPRGTCVPTGTSTSMPSGSKRTLGMTCRLRARAWPRVLDAASTRPRPRSAAAPAQPRLAARGSSAARRTAFDAWSSASMAGLIGRRVARPPWPASSAAQRARRWPRGRSSVSSSGGRSMRRPRGHQDALGLHPLLGQQAPARRPPRRGRTSRAACARPPRRSGRSSA